MFTLLALVIASSLKAAQTRALSFADGKLPFGG
jgi:hypothetical protein